MLTTASIVAYLVASVSWVIGDALIVGFTRPDKSEHSRLIELAGSDIPAFYTRINSTRLLIGAIIGPYTAPLYLAGLWVHWLILRDAEHPALGLTGLTLLVIGVVYMPLAHAGFYPVALSSARLQAALDRCESGADGITSPEIEDAALHTRRLMRFLALAWIPAIACAYVGGFLVCVPLALGWTALPWWSVLFTPVVQLFPWALLLRLPYPGKPLLDGAVFNVVNVVWALALLVLSPGRIG